MKKIIIIFILFSCQVSHAQVDTCLTKIQIQKIGITINSLNKKVEICDKVMKEYTNLEKMHSDMMVVDSTIIFTQKAEIGILKVVNSDLQNSLKKTQTIKNVYLASLIAVLVTTISIWRL